MDTDEVAAKLRTNRHARAALGVVAENLRRGYEVIDDMTPSALTDILAPAIGLVAEASDATVREQGRDLLDRTNAYAEGLYAVIHDDDEPLADDMRPRVALAMEQAESDLALLQVVRTDLVTTFEQDLADLVEAIGTATVEATRFIADKAKQIVGAVVPTWLWYVLGGALVVAAGVAAWRLSR